MKNEWVGEVHIMVVCTILWSYDVVRYGVSIFLFSGSPPPDGGGFGRGRLSCIVCTGSKDILEFLLSLSAQSELVELCVHLRRLLLFPRIKAEDIFG